VVDRIVEDFLEATPVDDGTQILYPGQRALRIREKNIEKGVSVDAAVWEQVKTL